jgi:hypothetical protein
MKTWRLVFTQVTDVLDIKQLTRCVNSFLVRRWTPRHRVRGSYSLYDGCELTGFTVIGHAGKFIRFLASRNLPTAYRF